MYCVLPSDCPATQCPVEDCFNLTALLNSDVLRGNVSNVTLLLFPGVHIVTSSVNRIFTIISATNFAIRAANSSLRAIIRCNGKIGFEFDSCTNLTIYDITIKNCGVLKYLDSHNLLEANVSMYISHSLGVYITHTHILNGTGIGLLLENVQYQLLILDSILSHNEGNLYIMCYDNGRVKSILSTMRILNSNLSNAKGIGGQHETKHSGIIIKLYQRKFRSEVELRNVNLVNNEIANMYAELNSCNSAVKLHKLNSVSINKKQNLRFNLIHSTKCINTGHVQQQNNFTLNNAFITGGETSIKGTGEKRHLINIFLNNIDFYQSLFSLIEIKQALLNNVAIKNNSHKTIYIQDCVVTFIGYFVFNNNQGSLLFLRNNLTFERYSSLVLRHNSQASESVLLLNDSNIKMRFNSSMVFENNTGSQSGGITLVNSTIRLENYTRMLFFNNTGERGGAMAFYTSSQLIFMQGFSNLTFIGNHATIVGGAIFVQDYDYVAIFKPHGHYHKFIEEAIKSNIIFINNTAVQAGNVLYGGTGNKKELSFVNSNKDNLSIASSSPFMVCMCNNSIPNCRSHSLFHDLIPGQPFKIDIVAVGQWNGVVPANIQIKFNETSNATVKADEYIQSAGRNCTKLVYTITSLKQNESINLQVITTSRNSVGQKRLCITFSLQNCTLGFSFASESKICVCNKILTDQGIECDIETLTIQRPSSKWINATFDHLPPSDHSGVIVHNLCPYDYCLLPTDKTVQQLNLSYPDQ